MAILKENTQGDKDPLFLKFVTRKYGIIDVLQCFQKSKDSFTLEAVSRALENPPDIEDFRKELEEAIRDIIKTGPGEEFRAFVNNYMENSISEVKENNMTPFGESRKQVAVIKDETEPWVQGLLCYNLVLYIKAFGLECLKACKTCQTLFSNKGRFAVYCRDTCNPKKKK